MIDIFQTIKLPTFKDWAENPKNEIQLEVFRSVCRTINPIICEICLKFGYPGYLNLVKILISFFGDHDMESHEIQELFQLFPVLHDAGIAAISPMNPISIGLLDGLNFVDSIEEISEQFLESLLVNHAFF